MTFSPQQQQNGSQVNSDGVDSISLSIEELSLNEKSLGDFEKDDNTDFPAWIFCIPEVVSAYGICPNLSINHKDRRVEWLATCHDAGELYRGCVGRLVNRSKYGTLEDQVATDKEAILSHVISVINESQMECPEKGVGHIQYVYDTVRNHQESKNRLRPARIQWEQVQKYMDEILYTCGINMSKLLKSVYGVNMRYRTPLNGITLDGVFETLIETLTRRVNSLISESNYIIKKREEGIRRLLKLIKTDFTLDQGGKYFKRWNMLTTDQQRERLDAFMHWHCRSNGIVPPIDNVRSVSASIVELVTNKKVKVSSIDWNVKTGIVNKVDFLDYDVESGLFVYTGAPVPKVTTASKVASVDGAVTTKKPRVRKPAASKQVTFARDTDLTVNDSTSTVVQITGNTPTVPRKRNRKPAKKPVSVLKDSSDSISNDTSRGRTGSINGCKKKVALTEEETACINRLVLHHLINMAPRVRPKTTIIRSVSEAFSSDKNAQSRALSYAATIVDKMSSVLNEQFAVMNC